MIDVVDIVLFAFLVVTAFAIIRLRDLFAAVMMASLFSLLAAGLFMVMDAPDVAFTEAAVGAGISTFLMLATLAITRREEKKRQKKVEIVPLILSLAVGVVLIYGTLDMPTYGDPEAPVHQHVAPRYLKESPKEVGVPNLVTAVLASYRGYDTFGETTVVFTAVVGALLLLGGRRRDRDAAYELTMGVDLREVERNQALRASRPSSAATAGNPGGDEP